MSAQIGASVVTVGSVVRGIFGRRFRTFAGMALTAMILGGCSVPLAPLGSADPADPGAKVAGVSYRSTIAPYDSLRPTTPSGWKEQNQSVARPPKSGHEH